MPWSITVQTSTTPHQAVFGELCQFNLTTAGVDSIVNVPSSPSVNTYFGVLLDGQANGLKIDVKTSGTVLYTLSVDNEFVWLAYNGSTWRVVNKGAPDPTFEARFSPLACWLSDGSDANLVDLSGNSQDLTKLVTIIKASGYGIGRIGTSYPGRYSRAAPASLQLLGAMSLEYVCINYMNGASTGFAFQCGTSAGASTTNILYSLRMETASGPPRWQWRQQNGANVNSDVAGPAIPFGPQHVLVTRAAPSGGTTAVKIYVNGGLGGSGSPTTPTGGSLSDVIWGGTAGAQAPLISQWGSIWNRELTAAEVAYLARLRLGKFGPVGA